MPQPYDMAFAFCKWVAHLERIVGPVESTAAHAMYEANLSVVEAAEQLRIAAKETDMQDDFGTEISASAMTAIFNAWIRFVLGDETIACEYSDDALRQYGVIV